jgi:peptidoglycan-N-acetylglucosamine deacetylase
MFFVKTPYWLKKIYRKYVWHIPVKEKILFLTFDDGPNANVTPFVLIELKKYNAKATFFCIGKNVVAAPHVYQQVLREGHSIGNHTHNHLKGWATEVNEYVDNALEASKHIDTKLFRPPYGRIKKEQAKILIKGMGYKIIMWDVISGDFDKNLDPEKCLQNVIKNAAPGSIIVFHDSDKAFNNMAYALPRTLKHFSEQGYRFEAIKYTSI